VSDNSTVNGTTIGGGDTFAADDIGGVKHQRVKMEYGADGSATDVSDTSPLPTKARPSGTGTITRVNAAAASTLILASNANRLGASIFNDSDAIAYVACAASASTSLFTLKMLPNTGPYELPFHYTGDVYATWASATGAAVMTEFTT